MFVHKDNTKETNRKKLKLNEMNHLQFGLVIIYKKKFNPLVSHLKLLSLLLPGKVIQFILLIIVKWMIIPDDDDDDDDTNDHQS